MIDLSLGQVIKQRTVIAVSCSVAWFCVIHSWFSIGSCKLPLSLRVLCWLSLLALKRCARCITVLCILVRSVWELLAIPGLHEWLRTHSPLSTSTLRILRLEGALTLICDHCLIDIYRFWVLAHVVIGNFSSLTCVDGVEILSLAYWILLRFWAFTMVHV